MIDAAFETETETLEDQAELCILILYITLTHTNTQRMKNTTNRTTNKLYKQFLYLF